MRNVYVSICFSRHLFTTLLKIYCHHQQIQFLLGSDGQPWTWVMGEHRDDLPYDELIRQRERQEREREEEEEREIRRQAEEFAKNETGHILSLASEILHDLVNAPST